MVRTQITGAQIRDATVDLTADVTGTLPASKGGTGNATNTLNNALLGNGTGALQTVAPGTAGNVLRSDGTTWASTALVKGDVGLGNVDNTSNATERTATRTLTGARITRRSTTTAGPGATPTINTDNVDYAEFTALAAAITSMTTNLTGTPVRGDTLWISFTDNGTARAITWGATFEASTVPLPTTTVISTRLDVGFMWNVATSKWRCVAVA